jgi:hypothetical protein
VESKSWSKLPITVADAYSRDTRGASGHLAHSRYTFVSLMIYSMFLLSPRHPSVGLHMISQ